jgi:hypothetical protein
MLIWCYLSNLQDLGRSRESMIWFARIGLIWFALVFSI